ncbi:MAG TPA: hypothetical protein VLE89_02610 [Chlamydiales bacterium]|nr:hypothetical protein [Chlamydiales bacterium]
MSSLPVSSACSGCCSAMPALPDGGFFKSHRPKVMGNLDPYLGRDVAGVVANYVTSGVDIFDAAAWKKTWGYAVGPDLEFSEKGQKFWFGLDRCNKDETKKVYAYEIHLPPVLCPEYVIDPKAGRKEDFTLEKFGEMIQHPQVGAHLSRYRWPDTKALRQYVKKISDEPAHYIVPRKDGVLFRGQSSANQIESMKKLNAETGAEYEVELSIRDVVIPVLAYNALWGTRYLGDATGMEGSHTYSCCSKTQVKYDKKTYSAVVGGLSPVTTDALGEASGGLTVGNSSRFNCGHYGMWGLRKFYGD